MGRRQPLNPVLCLPDQVLHCYICEGWPFSVSGNRKQKKSVNPQTGADLRLVKSGKDVGVKSSARSGYLGPERINEQVQGQVVLTIEKLLTRRCSSSSVFPGFTFSFFSIGVPVTVIL